MSSFDRALADMESTDSFVYVRQPGKYDVDLVSNMTGVKCEDESLAVQSEKDDADINTIVKRFGLTGGMPANPRVPSYGDFVGVDDFRSAMETVRNAQEAFMELPAEVRARFGNDPQTYMEFCTELAPEGGLANLEEMRKLGLAIPETVVVKPEPQEVRIVDAEAPPKE